MVLRESHAINMSSAVQHKLASARVLAWVLTQGGLWVVISRVISRITIVITCIWRLIAPLVAPRRLLGWVIVDLSIGGLVYASTLKHIPYSGTKYV